MSDKDTASKEYASWLDGIGLSGPISSEYHHDEIPGIINSSVLGKFSLDDLDFGDDMTKGRIDFDDEYLLKSSDIGRGTLSGYDLGSAGAVQTAHDHEDLRSEARSRLEARAESVRMRTDYPERDSQGGYYHPAYGPRPAAKAARREEPPKDSIFDFMGSKKRQMPESGLSVQETVFSGIRGAADRIGLNSDGVKNYIDKAPTQWKLRQEQKRSERMDPTRKGSGNKQQPKAIAAAGPVPREIPQGMGRPRGKKKPNAVYFIIIFAVLMRFIALVYEGITEPEVETPKPAVEVGVNVLPKEMVSDWENAFECLSSLREANDRFPLMTLSMDETTGYLTEHGWDITEIHEEEDNNYIEASFVQSWSEAYICVEANRVQFWFDWSDSEVPESEIEQAWKAILPDYEELYPGVPVTQSVIKPEMLQAVRDTGTKTDYTNTIEYHEYAGDVFVAVFDDAQSGWDLILRGDDDRVVYVNTDGLGKYIEYTKVEGAVNENFR